MEKPIYLDSNMMMILTDYFMDNGIEALNSKDGQYINSQGDFVNPAPIPGGITHIAAKGFRNRIIPRSLENMIGLAKEIHANACELGPLVSYSKPISKEDLTKAFNKLKSSIEQGKDPKNDSEGDLITYCSVVLYRI